MKAPAASALLFAALCIAAASAEGWSGIYLANQRTDLNLTVIKLAPTDKSDPNCYITGYPNPNFADVSSSVAATRSYHMPVNGPMTITVPVGEKVTAKLNKPEDTYIQNNNNYGALDQVALTQAPGVGYGLASVTFAPTAEGQTVYTLSSVMNGTNQQQYCLLNITFVAIPQSPPPAVPSPPPPTASPPPPASQGDACNGAVPCYCQGNYCFNNGVRLTTSCKPPSGQTGCKPVSIAPSQLGPGYATGYGSSVTVCQCQGPATSG